MGGHIRNAWGVARTFKGFAWSQILDALSGAGSVAQGDLLSRQSAAWARLAAGTAGRYLKTQGAAADPAWSTVSPASGGAMSFVAETVIAGGATTTLTVSGLDLDAHQHYFLMMAFNNAAVVDCNLLLTYNADTTAANYHRQTETRAGNLNAGARANDPVYMQMLQNNTGHGYGYIFRTPGSGLVSAMATGLQSETNVIGTFSSVHQWVTTATNVTSLVFTSSTATSIDNDSFVKVFRIQT